MSVADLPAVNATLNSISTCLILLGWWMIRRERKFGHIVCMSLALVTSAVFLSCYLVYHYFVGSVRFTEQGWIRPIYFTILLSHLILAIVNLPMIVATVVPAFRAQFEKHRRLARWTLPIWLYVSVTGVLVYFMIYQWFPPVNLEEILAPFR